MTLAVLMLEDEPEVRAAIERDLLEFSEHLRFEPAQDVEDAWEVVKEIVDDGDQLALVLCDHRLPGTTGVEFLVQMMEHKHTKRAKKVLVTGQADLADTVRAVNEAGLDRYIGKPWDAGELQTAVREMLTQYVEENRVNPLPYVSVLDNQRVWDLTRRFVGSD